MYGCLKIYVKKDRIGHIRYELYDDYGYKEIRGLSKSKIYNGETIYEKGIEDSHDISIYNPEEYIPSEEIPLEKEDFLRAMTYTRSNDENPPEYDLTGNNCRDFTAGVLAAAGKKGCVGDYLTKEQKAELRLSNLSDLDKCKIPKIIEEGMNKAKATVYNGIVQVSSYMRMGNMVEAYTRNCGRH